MSNNLILEDFMSEVLADCYRTFDIQPVPIRILVVEDMVQAYAELRPDHAKKQPEKIAMQKDNSGIVVPPTKDEDAFTILLAADYVKESTENNNANWIGTLAHEVVHVNDFIEFAKLVGTTDYDLILDTRNYRMFHLWTEFNAKVKGYYFLRKYTFDNLYDVAQVSFIVETELPFQIRTMLDAYNTTNDGDRQMYYVVHFLGMLYVWQRLFPKYFGDCDIKRMCNANPWMYEWYKFLKNHTRLEDACEDFEEMKEILKKNFSGI